MEDDYIFDPLPRNNFTMTKTKNTKRKKAKKETEKKNSCLFNGVSQMILIIILTLKSFKEILD